MLHNKNVLPTATAIIVAAGSGQRMGGNTNKQFIDISGMPVLAHTLLRFNNSPSIDSIIVVTKPCFIIDAEKLVDKYRISKVKHIIPGGETRQDSVLCGLKIAEDNALVAIHDGARPFISVEKINELVSLAHCRGAAALGVIPKDTVKYTSNQNTISKTIDRNSLRLIQTPQVFRASELKSAYQKAYEDGFAGTDDCSVAENAGIEIALVDGEYTNIKVTTPDDLPIAEAIYNYLKE